MNDIPPMPPDKTALGRPCAVCGQPAMYCSFVGEAYCATCFDSPAGHAHQREVIQRLREGTLTTRRRESTPNPFFRKGENR